VNGITFLEILVDRQDCPGEAESQEKSDSVSRDYGNENIVCIGLLAQSSPDFGDLGTY